MASDLLYGVSGALSAILTAAREHGRTARSKRLFPNVTFGARAFASSTCTFEGPAEICDGSDLHGVSFGKHSYCAEKVKIREATIGRYCSIGPEVLIGPGSHPTDWISTYSGFFASRRNTISFVKVKDFREYRHTVVGNDVWIGARAIVVAGVTIGDGAIIASGAVVSKDVEPYAIVGGVPARLIRHRLAPAIIEALLELKWWNWDEDKISRYAQQFAKPAELVNVLAMRERV